MTATPEHHERAQRHQARELRRNWRPPASAPAGPAVPAALALPAEQRLALLVLRGDALSLRCAAMLREMHVPEPGIAERLALEGMNYLAFGKLTPSGHYAASAVARDMMLKVERLRGDEFKLVFERGLIAGLQPVLAAQLLRLNGGVFGLSAAERIELHIAAEDRPPASDLIEWLTDAGFVHAEGEQGRLTPRGIARVQAVWRSCTSGWYGS
jgi:hypothetical protein